MGLLGKKKAEPEWIRLVPLASFSHSTSVVHASKSYALLREGDRVYCTQGSCSHEYSPLADGIVQDGEVYCEKHGSRFCLEDGRVLSPPACDNIRVFEVRIDEDGYIWANLW